MRTEVCELRWGKIASTKVRLHTDLVLTKTKFAQGQVQEEPACPAGCLDRNCLNSGPTVEEP